MKDLRIGMIGYGFMGKVHSNAYLKIPYSFAAPAAIPQSAAPLVALCPKPVHGRWTVTNAPSCVRAPSIEAKE